METSFASFIVEVALRTTVSNLDQQSIENLETTHLSWFLNADQLDEFLDRVLVEVARVLEVAKVAGHPELLQYRFEHDRLSLLERPVNDLVEMVAHYLFQVEVAGQPPDFGEMLRPLPSPSPSAEESIAQAAEEHPSASPAPNPAEDESSLAEFLEEQRQQAESREAEHKPFDTRKFLDTLREAPDAGAEPPHSGEDGGAPPLPSPPPAAAPEPAPALASPYATLVRVFYATDRLETPTPAGEVEYGALRSPLGALHYGRCEVSIPKSHKIGRLETPSILHLEFRPDPKKHIILARTLSMAENDFYDLVRASVTVSAAKDAFVFVHGYNVSFEDAARRTGQIAYDLDFIGAPIFYSWPSNGKTSDYLKDETNITWSTPHFQNFLGALALKSGAERIHILAHSMGNRAVCDTLKALSYDTTSKLKFNNLLLAAPDIDADTFQELAATLQRLSGRVTLYESSQDKALLASKVIHGNPRAGEPLLVVPGMDTIDASAIDTDFLGHSYFSNNWPLLSDIHSILFKDEPPSGRFGLVPMEHNGGMYYAFRP